MAPGRAARRAGCMWGPHQSRGGCFWSRACRPESPSRGSAGLAAPAERALSFPPAPEAAARPKEASRAVGRRSKPHGKKALPRALRRRSPAASRSGWRPGGPRCGAHSVGQPRGPQPSLLLRELPGLDSGLDPCRLLGFSLPPDTHFPRWDSSPVPTQGSVASI